MFSNRAIDAPELSFPRYLGDYLLVAPLGHDALGTVYRALHCADTKRYARLRILQSGELSPERVTTAVGRNAQRRSILSHPSFVLRPQWGVVEDVPFLAWYETGGWTLDAILAGGRALGRPLPVEFALLVAERIATALEQAWLTVVQGHPTHHGVLWPGFVHLSNDAEVRVGGFGLSDAVLPSLHKPRLSHEIAPYIAPEARERGKMGPNSDVYSLGVLLLELLTCRRPTQTGALFDWGTGDSFSKKIDCFLRVALAAPAERFSSVVEMHRALEELVEESPYLISTAKLALFLYQLLNLEGRSLRIDSDGESTNPVVAEPVVEDLTKLLREECPDLLDAEGVPILRAVEALPAPAEAAPVPLEIAGGFRGRGIFRREVTRRAWIGRAAATTAAAALGAGLLYWSSKPHREVAGTPAISPSHFASVSLPSPAPEPVPKQSSGLAPVALRQDAVIDVVPSVPKREPVARRRRAGKRMAVSVRSSAAVRPAEVLVAMRPAEQSRFHAGWARIEAERLEADRIAAAVFTEGKTSEGEGERLFRQGDYWAASLAFERAAGFFRHAESLSREERVRRVKLASFP